MIFFIFWKLNVKERNRRKKEKEKKNYIIIIGQRLVTTSLNIFLLDVNFDKFTIEKITSEYKSIANHHSNV